MADIELTQSQQLKQEQILAPQQIQSLEILLAPLLELQAKISQELCENPVLEQEKPTGEDLAGDVLTESSTAQDKDDKNSEGEPNTDEVLLKLMQLAESWHDFTPQYSQPAYTAEDEEKRRHFFESLTEEPSLQEQLLNQLSLMDTDKKTRKLAELIIGSIDEKGYLRSHLADLAIAGNAELKDVEEALSLVQTFDPPGIAARDMRECLLLQLKARGKANSLAAKLVKNHLEDIAQNKLPKITKEMKISFQKLHELLLEIRCLNPHPGSVLSPNNPIFVIPEVTVEKKGDKFVIIANDDNLPRLRISPFYSKLLNDPKTPEETINYIKTKLSRGNMLIKSIIQRQSTIRRIAEVIVDNQYDFFENGIEYLHPMTMQDVANKLNIHETTVSRAIANKYIQTPMGLFEFKFFFSTGYQSSNGEELSNKSIIEKIRDFVSEESKIKPISDQKIAELLKSQGITIARRTVAKYREEAGIPPSHLRKEFR